MSDQLYPCLWFDGNIKEAATFIVVFFLKMVKLQQNTPMVVNF